jgi:TfuA protein
MNDLTSTIDRAADARPPIVVFAGPSLRGGDMDDLHTLAATAGSELEFRRPVRRHDLLDLLGASGTHTVVMLDGEFGQSLAVSITEVRTVLSAGQRIAGASSMGALRAVECRTLGMTGSGWVYEQYLSGAVDSDGDVALTYDPEDFTPVTIPLVNLRWLLAEKVRAGSLDADVSVAALLAARGVHFRNRWADLLLRRWKQVLPAEAIDVLEPEMSDERRDTWDRKRLDAIEAVRMALGIWGSLLSAQQAPMIAKTFASFPGGKSS